MIATWRFSFVSVRAKHLPHSAFAKFRDDFVDAEAGAGCEGQTAGSIAVCVTATATTRYWARRAIVGETLIARHAGTRLAISAMSSSAAATATKVIGSVGPTP